uniref:Phosphate-regulating neutral endopeptidase (inferred by orthology to a human protein) n=1 Tax=Strongyloides venezuelensis TaxID=75913 RepID=A0A0K0G372_STRVS
MNAFIVILYIYTFFSASQKGALGFFGIKFDGKKENTPDMYSNPATVSLYEYLDPDVNPCDNFYKYACGKWIKSMEMLNKGEKNISIRSVQTNFLIFSDEALMGKYNLESKAIYNIYKLREKCKQLPKDKIKYCQSEIYNFGKYAVISLFIQKNEIRSKLYDDYIYIEDMIKRLKKEFRLLIDKKKDMFDEETRNYFKYKLDKMKFLKNLDLHDLSNMHLMESCYDNIGIIYYNIRIENFLENIKQIKKSQNNHTNNPTACMEKIFQPDKYMNSFAFSNGIYNPDGNYFSFSSDAVNQPWFSKKFPHSLNYGGIGTLIGHEIIRAFDSENYRRILEGENKNEFNVTTSSIKNFKEESDCFVEQYSVQKENITDKNINGSLTLARNIADNGGQKIAFRAYMNYLQSNGDKDSSVPAYEKFNKEQLFFIGAARRHCSYETEDILEKQIETNEYTPSEIRVNTAFSNSVYFYRAFSCPETTKMNDQLKCDLW